MNKNKFFPVLLVVMLLLTGFTYAANGSHFKFQQNKDNSSVVHFTLTERDYQILHFTAPNGEIYSKIIFNKGIVLEQEGAPEVPFINSAIRISNNANVYYRIIKSDYIEIKLDHPLLPSRGTIYRNQDPASIPYKRNLNFYGGGLYPPEISGLSEIYCLRDTRGTTLTLYPFQYDANKNILRVYTSISAKIQEKMERHIKNPLPDRANRKILRPASRLYNTIYLNNTEDRAWPGDEIEEKKGDILVIHTSRDTSAIAPYVLHKQSKGYSVITQLVNTGTNVKSTISSAYAQNPNILYVQLVGDWADIQCDLGGGASAPMDPMLGCVVGTDSFPDIIIGRFSAASSADVTTQIDKAIYYETHMNESWWTKGLGIGSGEGAGQGDDGEADYAHIDIIKENKLLPNGFTEVAEAYNTSATAAMVTNAVNPGCFIINYCGHGSKTSFVTTGFSNTNVNALTNNNMYPIIWSVACVNGEFHTSGDCFAEAWLKKQGGGAVATLMSTINQPWVPPMIGQDYMNDLLIGGYDYAANPGDGTSTDHGYSTYGLLSFNGMIMMYSQDSSSSSLQTLQTWTLFGDCSLSVRDNGPQPPTAAFDYSVNGLTVTFTDKSTDDGTITKWAWNFGDGTSSSQQNPTHTYASANTYTVTLTVTDNDNTTGTIPKTFFVGPQPPTADFIYTTNDTTASFIDKSTDNGYITQWNWEFIKGGATVGTSTLQNPSFNYGEYGNFQAKLTVKDNETPAQPNSITKPVEINQCTAYCESKGSNSSYEHIEQVTLDTYTKTSGNNNGYGDFTADVIDLLLGETYPISVTPGFSSGTYTEYVTVWIDYNKNCEFEENEKVFAPAASSSMVSGTITVPTTAATGKTRMRVSLKYSAYATACETIAYGEVEDYSINLTTDCEPPTACFTFGVNLYLASFNDCSTSVSPIVSRNWNFGDGSSSTLTNPTKTYSANGTYNVTLTVTNECGKSDSITKQVPINVTTCPYDHLVGSFPGIGIWLRDSENKSWTQLSKQQADIIRVGDVNGNGLEDIAAYFKSTGKLWYRYDNGVWEDIPASAATLTAFDLGDMNNDTIEDLVGSWSDKGLWWRNNANGVWAKLSNMTCTYVAAGDFDGDSKADVVGLFPILNSIWIYYSNNTWKQISKQINLVDLRAGNMDSDVKAELVGSWDIGVWTFDPETNNWVRHHASQAKQIAVGDINAQCMQDIVGYWNTTTPLHVKYMETNIWEKLSNYNPDTIDAGKVK